MIDLDKIASDMRTAAERATPGQWFCDKPAVDAATGFRRGVAIAATYGRQTIYADPPGGSFPSADQRHIATSNPANVLSILDDRDALKAKLAEAEALAMHNLALYAERDGLCKMLDSNCAALRSRVEKLEAAAKLAREAFDSSVVTWSDRGKPNVSQSVMLDRKKVEIARVALSARGQEFSISTEETSTDGVDEADELVQSWMDRDRE